MKRKVKKSSRIYPEEDIKAEESMRDYWDVAEKDEDWWK